MEPKSVRLDEEQHRFVSSDAIDFGGGVREWLDDRRVEEATGICADCGGVTYNRATTEIDTQTPIGDAVDNAVNLPEDASLLLCSSCTETAMEQAFSSTTGGDSFLPKQVYHVGYVEYHAECLAAAAATTGCRWEEVVLDRSPGASEHGKRPRTEDAVKTWLEMLDDPKSTFDEEPVALNDVVMRYFDARFGDVPSVGNTSMHG